MPTIPEAARNLEPMAMPKPMKMITATIWPRKTETRATFFGHNKLFCAKEQEHEMFWNGTVTFESTGPLVALAIAWVAIAKRWVDIAKVWVEIARPYIPSTVLPRLLVSRSAYGAQMMLKVTGRKPHDSNTIRMESSLSALHWRKPPIEP
jgi:hypothetical protein